VFERARYQAHVLRFAAVLLLAPLPSLVAAQPTSQVGVEGAQLYHSKCAPCHDPSAHGAEETGWLFDPPPPDLHRALQAETTATLVRRILDGPQQVTPRPRAPALTRTQALVSYLERLPRVNWPMVQRGRSLYIDRCERCHGAFGHPPAAEIRATGPRPRDLAASSFPVDDTALAALIRHERAGMPPLPADASEADVQALVAFVRLLSPGREVTKWRVRIATETKAFPPRTARPRTSCSIAPTSPRTTRRRLPRRCGTCSTREAPPPCRTFAASSRKLKPKPS
jgi:mono/diheme cytochrome c family protein